jgi:hypothetical protein
MQRAAVSPYWEGTRWSLPDTSSLKTEFSFQDANMLDYDSRALNNFFAWAPPKKADPNAPTIYILAYDDSTGAPLAGGKTYRLRVPVNVPARQYWSATVYDYETACFIREAPVISLDSYNQKIKKSPDGSVDIYFALIILIDDMGFGIPSAFGGSVHMPTAEMLASNGLRYNRFHTTTLCSPTRAALLTGRNHHMNNMGSITETATAFPGNTGQRPNTIAPLAEMLRLNGYSTAMFGKNHETAAWEIGPSGPTDRWPTRSATATSLSPMPTVRSTS